MGHYRRCLLIIISSTFLKLRDKTFPIIHQALGTHRPFYNRDLTEQQIAHKNTDKRKKCEGIITIEKANDYLMELQQYRESERDEKIMLSDKYIAV